MSIRYLAEECRKCTDNKESLTWCFECCAIPGDLLNNIEKSNKVKKANIKAAIEAKQKEIDINRSEIFKVDKIIEGVKEQQKRLLDKDTDLCYELEELKEQLK